MLPPCVCVADPRNFAVLEFNPLYGNWNLARVDQLWLSTWYLFISSVHHNLIRQKHYNYFTFS